MSFEREGTPLPISKASTPPTPPPGMYATVRDTTDVVIPSQGISGRPPLHHLYFFYCTVSTGRPMWILHPSTVGPTLDRRGRTSALYAFVLMLCHLVLMFLFTKPIIWFALPAV